MSSVSHSIFVFSRICVPFSLSSMSLVVALEAELEMLCHRSGQLLDYIRGRGTSLIKRLDNAS